MGLVQNHFYQGKGDNSTKKILFWKNKFTMEYLISWREKWWNAQYFPLFNSPDKDDFAMTYGHFMNVQEM